MLWLFDWPFFILGTSFIARYLAELLTFVFALTRESKLRPVRDSWALITASTDGIGLGFAEELARKGYNIIQVSRNKGKMAAVSQELQSKYGISCKNVEFSFSTWSENPSSHFELLAKSVDGLKVELVVNNVGTAVMGFESNLEKTLEMLAINVWPVVFISRILIEQSKKTGTMVQFINLSSIGAVPGLGLSSLSVYAATKALVMVFTQVLNSEGETALALTPGWVDTPSTKPCGNIRNMLITKNECALSALKQVGSVSCSYGHINHWIAAWQYRILNPRVAWLRLV